MVEHFVGIGHMVVPVDVWMAEDEFLAQRVAHAGNVIVTLFLAYAGIENHMQQYVAQFFFNFSLVATKQSVGQLHRFLYGVGAQALVGLHRVPWTTLAQCVHYIEQSLQCVQSSVTYIFGHNLVLCFVRILVWLQMPMRVRDTQ